MVDHPSEPAQYRLEQIATPIRTRGGPDLFQYHGAFTVKHVMARWLGLAAIGAAVAWYDPAGLRWIGVVVACVAGAVVLWRAARWDRRRRLRRTLEGLRSLPPAEFEAEVGRWLRRDGWCIEHRGGTGDGGIDLLATKGRETLAIQCKRYAESVAVSASQVRDLYGAAVAAGATGAVLVTTGRISRAAQEWCAALPAGPGAILIEGVELPFVAAGARLIR